MKRAALFLAGFFMMGCATTQITTLSRDDSAIHGYGKILVVIPSENDDIRNQIEHEFSKRLSGHGVKAVPSLTILPSQLDIQSNQAALICKDNLIGAVILIKELAPYAELVSNSPSGKAKPRLRHEIDFYDASGMHLLWTAESLTEGELLATSRVMIGSFFGQTIRVLRQQKLLAR
jgi:hypothetical protein